MKRKNFIYITVIQKKPPIGWFFELLELEYYSSLIASYLRSRLQKDANPIIFFTQAVLSLIADSFKVAPERKESPIKRIVL